MLRSKGKIKFDVQVVRVRSTVRHFERSRLLSEKATLGWIAALLLRTYLMGQVPRKLPRV